MQEKCVYMCVVTLPYYEQTSCKVCFFNIQDIKYKAVCCS